MNIQTRRLKTGIVYRACFGSGPTRMTRHFSRKADAQLWLAKLQAGQTEESENPATPIVVVEERAAEPAETKAGLQPIPFEELFELFAKGYAEIYQEPGTRKRERMIVKLHLVPYFGIKDVTTLDQQEIQQYLYHEARKGKRSAATINKHFQVIHKVFAWGVKNGLMRENPASGVSRLPTRDTVYSPDYKFLEEKDLHAVISKAQELYPKEFPVILTALCTGLRAGEVCALLRKDLLDCVANPILLVRRTYCGALKDFKDTTKGGHSRTVPVSDALLQVLKPIAAAKNGNDLLFFKDRKEAIEIRNTLLKKWRRVQKACGLEPRTFHALRHTYATLFLSKGGNTFALQRILGHSSAKITDKYSHFSQSMIESSRNVVQIPMQLPVATVSG